MPDSPADAPGGDGADRERPGNKVARLVEEYDLGETAAALEDSWAAQGENHWSLRKLAREFNERLLEHHLAENGQQPLKGEVGTLYELLTDEDVSESDRVRARRRLEQQGIDIGRLRDEFVSYQTVRRYLEHHRGITYTREETNRLETEAQTLQQLGGRVGAVAEDKLESLRDGGDLSLGRFRVAVDVRVYCEECQSRYPVDELFDNGGCECET